MDIVIKRSALPGRCFISDSAQPDGDSQILTHQSRATGPLRGAGDRSKSPTSRDGSPIRTNLLPPSDPSPTNGTVHSSPFGGAQGAASRYVSSSSSKPGRSAYRVAAERRTPNGERHVLRLFPFARFGRAKNCIDNRHVPDRTFQRDRQLGSLADAL